MPLTNCLTVVANRALIAVVSLPVGLIVARGAASLVVRPLGTEVSRGARQIGGSESINAYRHS